MREACGVFGVVLNRDCYEELKWGSSHLQLRGEEWGGFSIWAENRIWTEITRGWIKPLFEEKESRIPKGKMAIGHVSVLDPQPITVQESGVGPFALAFNGRITNRIELLKISPHFIRSDSETLAMLVAEGKDYLDGIENVFRHIKGSFSVVILTPEGVLAVRDPFGIKPLVLGKSVDGCAVASESAALDQIGMERIRDVKPGEIVQIVEEGFRTLKQMPSERLAICSFEFGYIARPSSIIEDIPVGQARFNMGAKLAQKDDIKADIVSGIPLSGISAAEGYHQASGIPFQNVFEYNPYIGRSYTPPSQKERDERAKAKLFVIAWAVIDKIIVLIDDSWVRGTQTKARVYSLIRAGAKEVHERLACPRIISPCSFDISTRTKEELPAAIYTIEEMRRMVGVRTLKFNIVEDFVEAIISAQSEERKTKNPLKAEDLCLGCFTGEYPVKLS